MQLLGLVFAGTATHRRQEMADFVVHVLGLSQVTVGGVDAEFFALPDGSHFAVAAERAPGAGTSRTIGFLVDDVDAALAELNAAGITTDEPIRTEDQVYAHFVAPDGKLYELIARY